MARFDLKGRADFLAGYSHTQDTGDGRSTALGSGTGPALARLPGRPDFPAFLPLSDGPPLYSNHPKDPMERGVSVLRLQ